MEIASSYNLIYKTKRNYQNTFGNLKEITETKCNFWNKMELNKRGISKASSVANQIAAFSIKYYIFSNRDLSRQRSSYPSSSTEALLRTHRSTKHQLQRKFCLKGRKTKELKAATKVLAPFTNGKQMK